MPAGQTSSYESSPRKRSGFRGRGIYIGFRDYRDYGVQGLGFRVSGLGFRA